jgi:pyruvate dehydrogenase E2 component (dihydrolipoamide acetyltransferase)
MPIKIVIPRLGWSMEEGVFVGWLKQDGDLVRDGEPLFVLEGEKASQDVESIGTGRLRIPEDAPAAGETVAVGKIIGYLLQSGEMAPAHSRSPGDRQPVASEPTAMRPLATRSTRRSRPPSSPLARRIAREHGIDFTKLRGSGRDGRIRRIDVLEAVKAQADSSLRSVSTSSIPITSMRRTIAARMLESRARNAAVTLTASADATHLVDLRAQFKAARNPAVSVPTFLDFTVKLAGIALREYPLLNGRWLDGSDRIETSESVHIGIAVDTDAGLVVPVIQNAETLGIQQIAAHTLELARKAREGRLRVSDTEGGTFTITNLGAFGVETFTPIINPPQCAILGMGKIEKTPTMEGDRVVGRDRLPLSLTFDHRIVDGAPAARFLQRIVQLLENPAPFLMP